MPERLVDINLLPRYERQRKGSSLLFFLFLFITIAAFISIGVFYYIFKGNLSDLEAEYSSLQAEEESLQAELASLDIAEGETLRHSVQFAEGQVIETSKLITRLDELLPSKAYLNSYTYRTNETSISAHLPSLGAVSTYTTQLTDADLLRDALVRNVTAVTQEDVEDDGEELKYYEANFTLDIERQILKKETKTDE